MITAAPSPADSASDATLGSARAERHKAALDTLVAMGVDLAGMLHRRAGLLDRATADADAAAANVAVAALTEVTAAFDQVARAVRRTVSLARVLETPVSPVSAAAGSSAGLAAGRDRVAARARVIRAVEDAIHTNVPEAERAEDLRAELFERIDAPEFDDVLTGRPVEEVIAEIRRDLGIAGIAGYRAPWVRRRPDAVAALQARARGEATGSDAVSLEAVRPDDRVAVTEQELAGLALRLVGVRLGRGPP